MKAKYTITNIVNRGKGRGKAMGFPTANISLDNSLAIPEGVYAAKVIIEEKEYLAATFVGAAKTFAETEKQVESFILGLNKDLYGKKIQVSLFAKIRDNQTFTSKEALVERMKIDVSEVKKYFGEII